MPLLMLPVNKTTMDHATPMLVVCVGFLISRGLFLKKNTLYISASREFEQPRGTTSGSWGQASWAGLPTDNWGLRNGGSTLCFF